MNVYRTTLKIIGMVGVGLVLAGCNPATKGWSSSSGLGVSSARLIAAKDKCDYQQARSKAIRLLKKRSNRNENERRAARLMSGAERCMKKYNFYYRPAR